MPHRAFIDLNRDLQIVGSGAVRRCQVHCVPEALGHLDMLRALGETMQFDSLATMPARAVIASSWYRYLRYVYVDVFLIIIQTIMLVLAGVEVLEEGSANKGAHVVILFFFAIKGFIDECLQAMDLVSTIRQTGRCKRPSIRNLMDIMRVVLE
eukprot:891567-Amphidinium_carterae.1